MIEKVMNYFRTKYKNWKAKRDLKKQDPFIYK